MKCLASKKDSKQPLHGVRTSSPYLVAIARFLAEIVS